MKPKTVRASAAKKTTKTAAVVERSATVRAAATPPVPAALPKAPAPQAVVPPPTKPVIPVVKPVIPTAQPAPPVAKPVVSAGPAASPKGSVTSITAKIDVGFGNALYIRGRGNGLSWDKGTLLQCVDSSTWVWSVPNAKEAAVFKVLLNDEIWSQGEDLTVTPGKQVEVVPAF